MSSKIRYELAKLLSQYFIFHLRQELEKPSKVTDFVTIEGVSFKDFTNSIIQDLQKKFPEEEFKPRFNLFKQWWERYFRNITSNNSSYEDTTFKTQNQIFYFKILDIYSSDTKRRAYFKKSMEYTIKSFKKAGRNVTFDVLLSSENKMLELLEIILRKSNLPFFACKKILLEQNNFIQESAYEVIDNELRESYKKTDHILKSILPEKIVEELKENGVVKPVLIKSVSILFCDLEGFTGIAENLSPENLLAELDDCYTHFDKIVKMNGLEKIKTIGDSYMACSGINQYNSINAILAVLCAIRLQEFLRKYEKSQLKKGLKSWKVRIGIHTGSVVAGILGHNRFNYDIWGDSVNIAQRMESSGEGRKINISKITKELTEKYFEFEDRGSLYVKGKGNMEMYFVLGIKKEYSLNGAGKTPNKKFRLELEKELK
jgi:class 3 adenylate cyclase